MASPPETRILYPESDGKPLADNTRPFGGIVRIKGGLEFLFRDRPDVFVAGDLLWYPVEGHPEIRVAPDALVVFGRPKGHRGSYKQWEEGDTPPQVVFEVLSPGNTQWERARKLRFYETYGVTEYYLYDPEEYDLTGWVRDRQTERLEPIAFVDGWVSPLLQIRFQFEETGLEIYASDGWRFRPYEEVAAEAVEAQKARDAAEQARDAAQARADRLAARLRALGVNPEEL